MEEFKKNIIRSDFPNILGQEHAKTQVKSALIMGRNIIIVGQPGIGKTTLAKNIAGLLPEKEVMDCGFNCISDKPSCPYCREKKGKKTLVKGESLFVRVQGSPDLTAEDLIGDIDPVKALKFGPMSTQAFSPGKIFRANNGILFFDEINRCSEKLQNALLQVLEEKKITVGSYVIDFDVDFIFIGTMNPNDTSTEPLSDVFLDRFDLIYMGFPESVDIELSIVKMQGQSVISFPEHLLRKVITFIHNLRFDPNIEKKPSVRATLGVYERAQAHALVRNAETVALEDVSAVLLSVLSHRITLKPSVKYMTKPEEYIEREFSAYVDREVSG